MVGEARQPTFGDKLVDFVGEPELPFLVRVAAGKAAKATVAQWREAGAPTDLDALRRLLPDGPSELAPSTD